MAQLAVPAHTHVLAVAWLRWRLFVNNFKRQQTGKRQIVGLGLIILLRIVIWSMFGSVVFGAVIGCGFLAWTAVAQHHAPGLLLLLAGISVVWQFLSINGLNIAAGLPSFDPTSLARFPLSFGTYLVLRILLGLLTLSTVAGCLVLLAVVIGIGIADHSLALAAVIVLAVYAWMNILFTRMVGALMQRWFASRRFRETFGVLTALFFIGTPFASLGGSSHVRGGSSWLLHFLQTSAPFLDWLPPGFAAHSILLKGHPVAELAQFSGLLGCTVLFLAIFAIRLHKQFLGEYLSEGSARSAPATSASGLRRSSPRTSTIVPPVAANRTRAAFPSVVGTCLRKEWLYLRGNGNQLMAMVTPLLLVIVIGVGTFHRDPELFLPTAIGYTLLGFVVGSYNIFGADGNGVQLYLLAPIRLRDVILAKNITNVMLMLFEAMLAWTLVLLLGRTPIPLSTQISTILWTVFVVAVNITVGMLRSIQAPHKVIPGRTAQTRVHTSRTSRLLAVAVLLGSLFLEAPIVYVSHHFGLPWLGTLIFAPLVGGAILGYALLLRHADELILAHRDLLAEELCKV